MTTELSPNDPPSDFPSALPASLLYFRFQGPLARYIFKFREIVKRIFQYCDRSTEPSWKFIFFRHEFASLGTLYSIKFLNLVLQFFPAQIEVLLDSHFLQNPNYIWTSNFTCFRSNFRWMQPNFMHLRHTRVQVFLKNVWFKRNFNECFLSLGARWNP